MPVSETVNFSAASSPDSCPGATSTSTSPCSVNLIALPTRLRRTCRRRPGSPTSGIRHVRQNAAGQLEPLLVGARGQQANGVFDDVADAERDAVERQLARLDFREVEDVVDQRQQRLARVLDRAQVVALLRGERRAERQLRHADDGVHRRPDLVAHVGEELALGDGRLFGAALGDLELPVGALAVGDVARGRVDQAEILVGDGRPLQPLVRAVRAPIPVLERGQLRIASRPRSPRSVASRSSG